MNNKNSLTSFLLDPVFGSVGVGMAASSQRQCPNTEHPAQCKECVECRQDEQERALFQSAKEEK